MAILGGSPLGLIGLKSIADPSTGRSTFNGGNTRNVDVYDYNRSRAGTLFTGQRRLRAWPNINGKMTPRYIDKDEVTGEGTGAVTEPDNDTTGNADVTFGNNTMKDGYTSPFDGDSWKGGTKGHKGQNVLHNNDVYDTSVLNLIEKLAPTKAALKPADFAYLKDVGVYPNNRLMICRRFISPSGDNIMVNNINKDGKSKDIPSLATMISWVPENDNFLEITFGEVWEEAKADFTGVLNSLGEDFSKTNVGGIAGAAANALPLPGFTEIFQRQFLASLGLLESSGANSIPSGNPNLIKEAKARKTIGYGEAGSGLAASVSIKMVCEYELKFISGIDPTIVWMDILGTIVRFGTSESSNYGLSQKVAAKISKWSRDPNSLLTDVVASIKDILEKVKKEMLEALDKIKNEAVSLALKAKKELEAVAAVKGTKDDTSKDPYWIASRAAESARSAGAAVLDTLLAGVKKSINGSIMKYRVQVMGIVNALTGNPSTPWHITVGNPLRPVFCSGDMLVSSTTLKLGPILAFNDLPSNIIAEFTVTNARPWGMQEIMAKFNSGYLRTVDVQKTFFETNATFDKEKDQVIFQETPGVLPGSKNSNVTFITPNIGATTSSVNGATTSVVNNSIIPTDKTVLPTPLSATVSSPIVSPETGVKGAPGSEGTASTTTSNTPTKQEGGIIPV
jgi:hypothetical protein